MELTTTPMMERQRKHRENSTQATQIANIAARFERLPLTSYQRGIFAIIATAWFVDSMDLGALTFVLGSIKQTFQLSTAEAGLLSSLSFLGMFVGAASAGLLADRFGRATVFQTSMIFWGLGSLACGVSSTVAMLGASRLLLGFGMGMEFPVAQSMVSEMIPAERRGRYIAYLEGFWPIGFIASGLLIYFVLSVAEWHWVFILQAIPALFVLVESWGRKGTLVLNLIGGAVACYFYGGATVQSQLIVAGLCMQFFLFGMWSALYAYTPELYPTAVRATGTGFASAVGRIGSLIGPTVIGLILPTAGQSGVFALGAGAFVIAALAVLILGEETKGRTLENISH